MTNSQCVIVNCDDFESWWWSNIRDLRKLIWCEESRPGWWQLVKSVCLTSSPCAASTISRELAISKLNPVDDTFNGVLRSICKLRQSFFTNMKTADKEQPVKGNMRRWIWDICHPHISVICHPQIRIFASPENRTFAVLNKVIFIISLDTSFAVLNKVFFIISLNTYIDCIPWPLSLRNFEIPWRY